MAQAKSTAESDESKSSVSAEPCKNLVLAGRQYGKMGNESKVYANFIRLVFEERSVCVYQIDISYKPIVSAWPVGVPSPAEKGAIMSPYDRRRIFSDWMADKGHTFCAHVNDYAYDGGSMIVARVPFNFPDQANEFEDQFRCLMERDVYRGSAAGGGRVQNVHLRISQRPDVHIDLDNIGMELSDTCDQSVTTQKQMIDMIMRSNRTSQLDRDAGFYRKFFPVAGGVFQIPPTNQPQGAYLGFGLHLWKGLFCSVRACGEVKVPMANFDVFNAAFHWMPGARLNDYFGETLGPGWLPSVWAGLNGQRRLHRQEDLTKLQWPFENLRVRAIHAKDKPQPYTVERIYFKTAVDMMFEWVPKPVKSPADQSGNDRVQQFLASRSTTFISIYDYFRVFYRIELQWPYLPLAETPARGSRGSGHAAKYNYFPLEVLEVATPQRFNGYVSGTSAVAIKESAKGPDHRMASIEKMVRDAFFANDPFLDRFAIGIGMNTGLVVTRARTLPPPRIHFGGNFTVMPQDGVFGTGVNKPTFYSPCRINSFGVIYVSAVDPSPSQLGVLSTFADRVGMLAQQFLGQDCQQQAATTACAKLDGIKEALMKCVDSAKDQTGAEMPSIVFCVMPKRDLTVYSNIKRVAEIELGVMTQCLLISTARDVINNQTVRENLFMKVNCKLGGRTFITEASANEEVVELMSGKDGTLMVVGIDVLHPSANADPKMPSIATFLGSTDKELVTYKAVVKVQKVKNDHIVYMFDAMSELLIAWMNKNPHTRMNNLIVLRDGVNEDQMEQVVTEEAHDLSRVLKQFCLSPDITYIVVDKQHHVRFFPVNSSDPSQVSGRFKNVLPGLVVDRDVTDPHFFDWYQAPHQCIKGMTRPIKYTCLRNDADLSADCLQYLMLLLCHSLQRCTRAVHSPAPLYYARLVALRASYHMLKPVSEMSGGGLGDNEPLGIGRELEYTKLIKVLQDVIEQGMYFM